MSEILSEFARRIVKIMMLIFVFAFAIGFLGIDAFAGRAARRAEQHRPLACGMFAAPGTTRFTPVGARTAGHRFPDPADGLWRSAFRDPD